MTIGQLVRNYFVALARKRDWESFLAEDFAFTSHAAPTRRLSGKEAYLASTQRFFSMVSSLEVKNLIVDGANACALTRYELRPPAGPAFHSDVAEVFVVKDSEIASLDIYFDSAPFPK
jgi:ketosteroid isomerase-like protein